MIGTTIDIQVPEQRWQVIAEGDETKCDLAILTGFPVEVRRSRETTVSPEGYTRTTYSYMVGDDGVWLPGVGERAGFNRAMAKALRLLLKGGAL